MELRQLEYFRKIADTGSINEAARRLNMSQPPLSYQLRLLEEELGVLLFVRTGKGVVLTEAGKLLYDRSGNLLEYAHSTRQEVTEAGKKRVLRIGITSSTVSVVLPYISQFTRQYPDVNFEVRDGTTFTLLQQLLDGIIDISVARTPLRTEEVESVMLRREPMIAVSPPRLLVEKEGDIGLSQLEHTPLILYRRYEELIIGAFDRHKLRPDIFCVCDDARDALLWVQEGLATAIFPASMSSLCQGLRVQRLAEKELETQIVLIWKKGVRLSPVVQDFLTVCLKTTESGG